MGAHGDMGEGRVKASFGYMTGEELAPGSKHPVGKKLFCKYHGVQQGALHNLNTVPCKVCKAEGRFSTQVTGRGVTVQIYKQSVSKGMCRECGSKASRANCSDSLGMVSSAPECGPVHVDKAAGVSVTGAVEDGPCPPPAGSDGGSDDVPTTNLEQEIMGSTVFGPDVEAVETNLEERLAATVDEALTSSEGALTSSSHSITGSVRENLILGYLQGEFEREWTISARKALGIAGKRYRFPDVTMENDDDGAVVLVECDPGSHMEYKAEDEAIRTLQILQVYFKRGYQRIKMVRVDPGSDVSESRKRMRALGVLIDGQTDGVTVDYVGYSERRANELRQLTRIALEGLNSCFLIRQGIGNGEESGSW